MPTPRRIPGYRYLVIAVVVGLSVLLGAQPASAHVEVSAQPARAGAQNAVLSFDAEAESQTAGITGLKVQLPDGITPTDVALVKAPAGWRFASTADGYQVSGPAVPAGQNATYSVRVAQLPNARTLYFKTIQSYSDGRQDGWIELPPAAGGEAPMPAPALTLAAAAPTTAPPTTAAPTTDASIVDPTPSTPAAAGDGDGGVRAGMWILIAALVVLVAGAAIYLWRRRSATGQAP